MDPIRFGILGTARIAAKVGRAIVAAQGATLAAVASRNEDRAQNWVARHTRTAAANAGEAAFLDAGNSVRALGGYEALLDDPAIDAVYIPLPPSLHAEWTIRAAERGKHVLCEKPLAANLAEARQMADACRTNRVCLMDGVMWAHHERTAAMRRVIDSDELGSLRRVTSAFSFNATDFSPDNIRFQKELAGGVLGDLGWYCVGATLWALGDLPERVFASARYHNDVDVSLSAMLWFAGDRTASFDCAYNITMRKWIEIAGAKGSLVCDDFVLPWNPEQARFWVHGRDGKASQQAFSGCIQELRMIERFCDSVRHNSPDDSFVRSSLATQEVCDALASSARSGRVIEIEPR